MSAKPNRDRRNARRLSGNLGRRRPQVESLESRLLLASDWTNPINIYNVDGNDAVEAVAPLDALLVINELNVRTISSQTGLLPELGENDADPNVFFDVNGDGQVSPIDALMVVNYLNANGVVYQGPQSFAAASVIVGSRAALAGGISDDTLVNTQTSRVQNMPDVASTALGDSVVVWQSFHQDGRGWGIYGQRFDPTGAAVGEEFQVNTTTKGSQTNAAVAMSEDGNFVVVWHSVHGADGSGFGVYAQEFDSSGNRVGTEQLVNSTTRGKQADADVAYSGSDYTVVWQGRGEGDVNGIFARTFSGGTGGTEILVNNYTRGFQGHPVVSGNASGTTVVAWQGKGDGDAYGIFMRDISSAGSEQVMVNSETRGLQHLPSVAVGTGGEITVAWRNPPHGIWARTFAADGTGGSVIQVNETDPGIQTQPDVTALVGGGFAATWQGNGVGDHRGTFVRSFGADGSATSDETLVNQTTRAAQIRPSIAAANEGYIVSWQGRGEGDRHGVFARFFETDIAGPFSVNATADSAIDEGTTFTTTVSVTTTDNSGSVPVFSLATAPAGATIDASTGVITWATSETDGPGTFEFVVNATAGDFVSSDTFMVTVNEVNALPTLSPIADVTALVDMATTITVSAADADLPAQNLSFSVSGNPSWLTLDTATGTLSGTPTASDAGVSTVVLTVSDGAGGTAMQTFTVTATANQAPVVSTEIADTSVNEAEALSLDVSGNFSDPESDPISFTSANLPSWASLSSAGVLTGTPGNADVGVTAVVITATDSNGGMVTDTFNLTVVDVNTLTPTVLGSSFRVADNATAGTSVGSVIAQDLDPSAVLNYSIASGNDAGAFAINSATGEITVANAAALAGLPTSNTLNVSVSDGVNSASGDVTVVVTDAAVRVGYSLQVVDPDNGDAVLTTVTAGQTVHLLLQVQTVQDGSPGAFAAYADILYNPGTATVASGAVHADPYTNGTSADTAVAGVIDDAGGFDGLSVLDNAVYEVLRVPMTIGNLPAGTVVPFEAVSFASNSGPNATFDTLIFGSNTPVPSSEISYSGASVTVSEPQASLAAVVDAAFADDDDDDEDDV